MTRDEWDDYGKLGKLEMTGMTRDDWGCLRMTGMTTDDRDD